jgi:hypothetical protein
MIEGWGFLMSDRTMARFISWGFALVRWGLALSIIGLIWEAPALASEWLPVTPPDLEQQFIDVASIQTLPEGTVQVRSLYQNQRQQPTQRTTYTTEYRCQERLFRDVDYNGKPGDLTWHSVEGDPLNAQTLDYVCAQGGQASTTAPVPSEAKN